MLWTATLTVVSPLHCRMIIVAARVTLASPEAPAVPVLFGADVAAARAGRCITGHGGRCRWCGGGGLGHDRRKILVLVIHEKAVLLVLAGYLPGLPLLHRFGAQDWSQQG